MALSCNLVIRERASTLYLGFGSMAEVQSDVVLSDECGSLSDEDSNGGPVVVTGNLKFPWEVSAILEGCTRKAYWMGKDAQCLF